MKKAQYFLSFILFLFIAPALPAQQDTILVEASHESGAIGDTVCVQISVDNFREITAFQFPILWDPTYMEFVEITNEHPDVNFTGLSFGLGNVNRGLISIVHFDPSLQGYTVPNGSILFEACFEITGPPGADNPVRLQNHPIVTEFVRNNAQHPHRTDNGQVEIESSDAPAWVIAHCASLPDSAIGYITAGIYGSVIGWELYWFNLSQPMHSGTVEVEQEGQNITIDSLIPGDYVIQLLDPSGQVALEDTLFIDSTGRPNADYYSSVPTCADSSDALYGFNEISDGVEPYFTRWTGQHFLFEKLTDLTNGIYFSTIKDVNGCTIHDTVELFTAPVSVNGTVTGVSCRDSLDGMIQWTLNGGNPYDGGLYNIFLNDSFISRDSVLQMSELSPTDTLNFFFTDSLGCSLDTSVHISRGRRLQFDSVAYRSTNCWNVNDGFIELHIKTEGPAFPPYRAEVSGNISSYTLENGVFRAEQLGEGTYNVEILDNGPGSCPIDTSITLFRPDTLTLQLIETKDDDCTPVATGRVEISAEGGSVEDSTMYTFEWNNGHTGPVNDSIISGMYSVTVTDTLGCQRTSSYRVGNDQGPVIDSVLISDVQCYGDSTGRAEIHYTPGDTSDVNLVWSDGETDSIRMNLPAGMYSVTVSDANGCMAFTTAQVDQPDSLSFSVSSMPEIDDMMNGQVELEVFGGSPPYTIEWFMDSSSIDPDALDSLLEGTYTFIITDDNGCHLSDSVEVGGFTTDINRPDQRIDWILFPNPAKHLISLKNIGSRNPMIVWKLLDVHGKLLRSKHYCNGSHSEITIDISTLNPGVYFLYLELRDGEDRTMRLIKN